MNVYIDDFCALLAPRDFIEPGATAVPSVRKIPACRITIFSWQLYSDEVADVCPVLIFQVREHLQSMLSTIFKEN